MSSSRRYSDTTRSREGIKNNDLVPNIDSHNYLLENLEITINYLIEFKITFNTHAIITIHIVNFYSMKII